MKSRAQFFSLFAIATLSISAVSCGKSASKKNTAASNVVKQGENKPENPKSNTLPSSTGSLDTTAGTPSNLPTPPETTPPSEGSVTTPVASTFTAEVQTAFANNCAGCHFAVKTIEDFKLPSSEDNSKQRGLNWAKESAFRMKLTKTDRETGANPMPYGCFENCDISENAELVLLLNWFESGVELN